MGRYQQVMQQFLETERSVMLAYLTGRQAPAAPAAAPVPLAAAPPAALPVAPAAAPPASATAVVPRRRHGDRRPPPCRPPPRPTAAPS